MEHCEKFYSRLNLREMYVRLLGGILTAVFLSILSLAAHEFTENFTKGIHEGDDRAKADKEAEITEEKVLFTDLYGMMESAVSTASGMIKADRYSDIAADSPALPAEATYVPEAIPVNEETVTTDIVTEVPVEKDEESMVPEIPITPETDVPLENPDGENGAGTVVSVNGFLVDEAGMIYGIEPGTEILYDGYLLSLPQENVNGIRKGAFADISAGAIEMYIPENITNIEAGAFIGLNELEWIETAPGNESYASRDGVLVTSDLSCIVAFPSGRIETYIVPETVTRFEDDSFFHTSLTKIDMRLCGIVEIGTSIFGEGNGTGITITVPEGTEEIYQNAFLCYDVTVESAF
ncbi:leucine-rich repeat protein [Mediterraneibacter sp. NSJ-55]|uniref:Leucine-rich repeat protein n=1 Tax=Mediterraneibacter hominis TaxID=2763054 RepID=A0A923RQQ8_9FIRM|nr:leucine-rich repeat protein [Mediterraneibacter hominis]MBC5687602.1 leucine-rich repeat protein [Mediterraneibacter hominis]